MPELHSYIQQLAVTVREYVHDLRQENEVLRTLLRSTPALPDEQLSGLRQSLDGEPAERRVRREALLRTVVDLEAEFARATADHADIEQQYSDLLNLFVASQSLHRALEKQEVLQALVEIIINIIGSEELAIFELEERRGALRLAASFGVDRRALEHVDPSAGIIGHAIKTGRTWVGTSEATDRETHEAGVSAVVPLRVSDRVTGAIVIYRLLAHKPALTSVDHELLALLETHGATALYLSALHGAEQRSACT